MAPRPLPTLILVVGLVALLLAGLGATGVVPLSTVGVQSSTCGGSVLQSPAPIAAFDWSSTLVPSGNNSQLTSSVTVTLHNCVPIISALNGGSNSVQIRWGDGTSTFLNGSALSATSVQSHTYPSASAYTVTDIVTHSGSAGSAVVTVAVSAVAKGVESGYVASSSPDGNARVIPSFAHSASGLSVNATDTSVGVNETVATVDWAWGDGMNSTGTPGGSTTHAYSRSGTYVITETVTGGAFSAVPGSNGTLSAGTYTVSVPVTVSVATQSPTTSTQQSASSPASGPLVIGLAVFGGMMVVAGLVAFVRPEYGAIIAAFALAALPTAYILAGGNL